MAGLLAAGALPRLAWSDSAPAARKAPEHALTVIAGGPRNRGRMYGARFKDDIATFIDREIYRAFADTRTPKDAMLRYAGQCAAAVKSYSPVVMDELEGMAEGSGLKVEELVLLNLHEELWHRGALPPAEHCTAVAVGPAEKGGAGDSFVGQTWDWMASVYGLSSMLHWERPKEEGPSVLAYAYPGLWVGAGLNSAGVALCWTSAGGGAGPRVGIPSYLLIAHMLYQPSLDATLEEARRARNAGWFTFALADAGGRLANVEGSPDKGVVVEETRGRLVRHNYGSRAMTGREDDRGVNDRCALVHELLDGRAGSRAGAGRPDLEAVFADGRIGGGALDVMIFNTTRREALVTRGPGDRKSWKRFTFDG